MTTLSALVTNLQDTIIISVNIALCPTTAPTVRTSLPVKPYCKRDARDKQYDKHDNEQPKPTDIGHHSSSCGISLSFASGKNRPCAASNKHLILPTSPTAPCLFFASIS